MMERGYIYKWGENGKGHRLEDRLVHVQMEREWMSTESLSGARLFRLGRRVVSS